MGARRVVESRADRGDRRINFGLFDDDPVRFVIDDLAGGRGLPGRSAKLDLQPPAAVVGARLAPELDGADFGHPRRQAHRVRSALALRLTRIRLCKGGSSRIESGSD